MRTEPDPDARPLPAGAFSEWLRQTERALSGRGDAEVPCDGCTACCTSSQFVHIAPNEADTLAHIPVALLFSAPRAPEGHVLLGYDRRGHCPMLRDGACSIYEHRPRTCRTYDCRVFPASGVRLTAPAKVRIATRADRWRFQFPTEGDRAEHRAIRAAGRFLLEHPGVFPDGERPKDETELAVLAVEAHAPFLGTEAPEPEEVEESVRRALDTNGQAEAGSGPPGRS